MNKDIQLATRLPRISSTQQYIDPQTSIYTRPSTIRTLVSPSKAGTTLSRMPPPIPHQPSSRDHATTTTTATATQTLTSTPVLRLRGTSPSPHNRRRIQWAEDVVDNEGLGRKKSKLCCIFHAEHEVGESSSESSSSSDDDSSDSDTGRNDDGRARMGGNGKAKKTKRHQHDEPGQGCGHDHDDVGRDGRAKTKKKSRNAYETAPKVKKAEKKSQEVS